MLIGIDASAAGILEKSAPERALWHVLQTLRSTEGQEQHQWMLYAPQTLPIGLGVFPKNWHERQVSFASSSNGGARWRFSWELYRRRPEVLFLPTGGLPLVTPRRTVMVLSDIAVLRYPELFSRTEQWRRRRVLRQALKRVKKIVVWSEYAKQELVQRYGAADEQVFIVSPGVQEEAMTDASGQAGRELLNRYRISGPYFLCIGRSMRQKNLLTLIEAFRRYKEDRGLGDPVSLVLVGAEGDAASEVKQTIQRASLGAALIQTGYISEGDKRMLLSGALALVEPSWSADVAWTPLEAMSDGCPVICTRAGGLPETVGVENALWFEPNDPESLTGCFEQLMRDAAVAQTLRERGKQWAPHFSWQQTSREFLSILTDWS